MDVHHWLLAGVTEKSLYNQKQQTSAYQYRERAIKEVLWPLHLVCWPSSQLVGYCAKQGAELGWPLVWSDVSQGGAARATSTEVNVQMIALSP